MNDRKTEVDGLPAEIDLLMFNSAGLKMAVDTIQVDCIMNSEQAANHNIDIMTLNECLGSENESSQASTVILYRNGVDLYGLRVEGLDTIITAPIQAIQPIPEPLSYFVKTRLFWGFVLRGNDVILLIDLFRLNCLKSSFTIPTA